MGFIGFDQACNQYPGECRAAEAVYRRPRPRPSSLVLDLFVICFEDEDEWAPARTHVRWFFGLADGPGSAHYPLGLQ